MSARHGRHQGQPAAATSADWQAFVIAHGRGALASDLGAVLGRDVEQVRRVRATGACARGGPVHSFSELFALWHGRAPVDADWPAPTRGAAGSYEWQVPELALLATQVGQVGVSGLATLLTARLRALTGDPDAIRTPAAVRAASRCSDYRAGTWWAA